MVMADMGRMAYIMQLMAQAGNDPELRKQIAQKAAEAGLDPEEVMAQGQQSVQGGNGMPGAALGSVMAPTIQSASAAGGGAGAGGAGLLQALGAIQPPQNPQLPPVGTPGLRTSPGIDGGQLLQLILGQILKGNLAAQQAQPSGLGSLITG